MAASHDPLEGSPFTSPVEGGIGGGGGGAGPDRGSISSQSSFSEMNARRPSVTLHKRGGGKGK